MTIFLFKNVRTVIEAEKVLVAKGVAVTIRPVPTDISSECGMCLQLSDGVAEVSSDMLHEKNISFQKVER